MPDGEISNVQVSAADGPQNEPSVAASLRDPRIIIATANDYTRDHTRTALYRSTDGGHTFSRRLLPRPDGFNLTSDGTVDFAFNRQFLVAAIAANRVEVGGRLRALDGSVVVYPSDDDGRTFESPVIVRRGRGREIFHDKSYLATDKSARSPYDGSAYVSYTIFLDDFTDALLAVQRSRDGGRSWSAPVALTRSGAAAQGSSIAVGRQGQVYVSWIQFASATEARFRLRRSDDGGRTFAPAVTVAEFNLVPVCRSGQARDCLPVRRWRFRTPTFSYAAVDISDGPAADTVYAVWQELNGDRAEIWLARSQSDGDRWSAPIRLSGSGQSFFPNIAVSPQTGDVWVTYYGNELSPPPGTLLDLYVAESPRGGRRFRRRLVSSRPFSPNADPYFGDPSRFLGDYIGVAPRADGGFVAVWTDTSTGSQEIFAGITD